MLMILGTGRLPLLGVILQDLSLSPLGATVTSARIFFIGWGGEGFPQIKLRGEEKGDEEEKCMMGKTDVLTYLHPALKLNSEPLFTPVSAI